MCYNFIADSKETQLFKPISKYYTLTIGFRHLQVTVVGAEGTVVVFTPVVTTAVVSEIFIQFL